MRPYHINFWMVVKKIHFLFHNVKKCVKAAFFTSLLAGRAGFEPAVGLDTRQPLSRRPHSTTLAPPRVHR